MIFNSLSFAAFFTLVCALMALTNIKKLTDLLPFPVGRLRRIMLLLAGYVFYGIWDIGCCLLLLGITAASYFCALGWAKSGKKLWVTAGVVLPLIVLGIFKYFNFFVASFCAVFGIADAGALKLLLPLGISFYTFQSLGYVVDVYRGKAPAERDFVTVALFTAFFPLLVSGPIARAGQLMPQFSQDRNISLKNLEAGVQYFTFGLFKKLVIADNISVFVNAVYDNPAEFHGFTVLLAVVAYSIQIYCDFSGYSDMAVGCARCLGYELPRNFDLPYLSRNVSEFWKRWHISLSSWLKDYVYIPLGGNRKGELKSYVNLFLTMLIGGLWHGANWTYVVWGGLHGVALCVHKRYLKMKKARGITGEPPWAVALSTVCTFLFVSLCLVFFRADSFRNAWSVLAAVFTWQRGVVFVSSWAVLGILLVAAAEFAAVVRCRKRGGPLAGVYPTVSLNTVSGLVIFFVFLGLTLGLGYTGVNPFIYAQF